MSCRVKGKDKNEKIRSRGRVKMRNGVGEATGGTWPTYSRGGVAKEEERWETKTWEREKKKKEVGDEKAWKSGDAGRMERRAPGQWGEG